jgi:phosphate transport system permease protein
MRRADWCGAAIFLQDIPNAIVSRVLRRPTSPIWPVCRLLFTAFWALALVCAFFPVGAQVMAGALTLALLVMPMWLSRAQEALRGVPSSLRDASYALGATRWQTIRGQVLPDSHARNSDRRYSGVIARHRRNRAAIMMGALTYVAFVPSGPLDGFTTLPIQVFNWTSRPQPAFQNIALRASSCAGGFTFLNATAIHPAFSLKQKVVNSDFRSGLHALLNSAFRLLNLVSLYKNRA